MKGGYTFAVAALTTGLLIAGILADAAPAAAQADVCGKGRTLFQERQSLMNRMSTWRNKKVDPGTACKTLTQLQGNGNRTLAWLNENKDWCQVPDQAVTAIKSQHAQVGSSRNNACKAAADYNKAASQARKQAQQAQQGGNSGFGGVDDFTGAPRPVPQGAL
jgi:hypothetical protein